MKKRKLKKFLGFSGLVILMIGIFIFFYLKTNSYHPTSEALKISQKAEVQDDTLVFKGNPNKTSIIFYQGALVDNKSYSIWAKIIKANKINNQVIGGHSLGGVIASRFAENRISDSSLKGVFFLASYPDKKGSLTNFNGEILSIVGSHDGVLNRSSYQKAKQYLPQQTKYIKIEGGNHSGFGSYGFQKGDKKASISNLQQQEAIFQTLNNWLIRLDQIRLDIL